MEIATQLAGIIGNGFEHNVALVEMVAQVSVD